MRKIGLFLLLVSSLFAHKVNLFLTTKEDKVEVYSYLGNAVPCKNCKITIKSEGKTIIIDKLDDEGKYTFTPKSKSLEIIIDAMSGHIVKENISLENIVTKDLQEYQKEENVDKYIKIVLAIVLIFIFFFIFKKVKSRK